MHDDGHCIGLIPEQLDASLSVLRRMADTLKASISIKEYLPGRAGHEYAVVEVKNGVNENITSSDVRIAGESVQGHWHTSQSIVIDSPCYLLVIYLL